MTTITEEEEDSIKEYKSPIPDRLPPTTKQTPQMLSKSPKLVISDRFLARQKAMQGKSAPRSSSQNGKTDEDVIMIGPSANRSDHSSTVPSVLSN